MAKAKQTKGNLRNNDFIYPIEKFKVNDKTLEEASLAISYFRQFPFAFCEEYLDIRLHMFQKILLYEMMHKTNFIYIACRNIGKTYMTAVYICCRCILYPKTKVIIVAPEKAQSSEIITKIEEIRANSPNLRNEIADIGDAINNTRCTFWNGSTVRTVTMSENARSKRANLVVIDEYVWTDKNIIDNVVTNFLGDPRAPGYLKEDKYYNKPEYAYLKEKDTEIYLSSAGHKGSWAYVRFRDYFNKMLTNPDYFVCSLPYQTAVAEGLRDISFYYKQMKKEDHNEAKGKAEYEGVWIDDGEDNFYKYESLEVCRKIAKATYPQDLTDLVNKKDSKFLNKKRDREKIRILAADIAMVGSRKNDASAYGVIELTLKQRTVNITTENGVMKDRISYYDRDLIYLETHVGASTQFQDNRLKRLKYDFDCNYTVIDAQNFGVSIIDMLGEPSTDPETGTDYKPIKCMNKEEYAIRCSFPSAEKTLFAVNASATLNDTMARGLQSAITQKKLNLLINDGKASDTLRLIKGYEGAEGFPTDVKASLKRPFLETKYLVEEMTSLEKKNKDGELLKLKEPSSGRKDRYTMLLYGNALADELELRLKNEDTYDDEDDIVYSF